MISKVSLGSSYRRAVSVCSVLAFSCLPVMLGCASRDSEKFEISAPAFVPEQPKEFKLENGLTVLFLKNSELPIVRGTLYMPGGALWEEKAGVASAMGSQLRQGGTSELAPDQLDQRLQELQCRIGTGFGDEFGTASFFTLTADIDQSLKLFADVLRKPRFDQARLELWKARNRDEIKRRIDDPSTVAGVALRELVVGTDSPYGRILLEKDVAAIGREDLLRSYEKFVSPQGAILAISGDLEEKQALELVRRHLGDWKGVAKSFTPPKLGSGGTPGIYFIELPFQQASVLLGHQGVARQTPDQFAISLFNEAFGGGFSSLLTMEVRVARGLVYGIDGGISPGLVRGQNYIAFQTKAASTGEAIAVSAGVLNQLKREALRKSEIEQYRDSIVNAHVFKNAAKNQQVNRAATLRILGYPDNYDSIYLSAIGKVSPGELQQVAVSRWEPESFRIVVVGNKEACQALLATQLPESLAALPIYRAGFGEKLENVRPSTRDRLCQ